MRGELLEQPVFPAAVIPAAADVTLHTAELRVLPVLLLLRSGEQDRDGVTGERSAELAERLELELEEREEQRERLEEPDRDSEPEPLPSLSLCLRVAVEPWAPGP